MLSSKYENWFNIYKCFAGYVYLVFLSLIYVADKGLLYWYFSCVIVLTAGLLIVDNKQFVQISKSRILAIFVIFSLYMLIRESMSPDVSWEHYGRDLRTWLKILVFTLATAYVGRQLKSFENTMKFLVFSALLYGCYIFSDYLINYNEVYSKLPGYIIGHNSNFFWHTYFGGAFAFAAVVCLYLINTTENRSYAIFFSVVAVFFVFLVLMSRSRGALLPLVFCSIFFICLSSKRRITSLLIALSVFVVLLAFGSYFIYDTSTLIARKDAGRFILWQHALDQINENRFWGGGLSAKYSYDLGEIVVDKPHNILLSVGIAGGYFGIILFLLIYIVAAIKTFIINNKREGRLVFALLMFSFIFHMFDTQKLFYRPTIDWILLWLPIGLAIALESNADFFHKQVADDVG